MLVKSKSKNTKKRKSLQDTTGWFELVERKDEFLDIIRILNRYYSMHPPTHHPSDAYLFREKMIQCSRDMLRIYLKNFGEYEFLVTVKIIDDNREQMESWIHVDGIMQERDQLLQEGKSKHPVHNIICITDLFQKSCRKLEEELDIE